MSHKTKNTKKGEKVADHGDALDQQLKNLEDEAAIAGGSTTPETELKSLMVSLISNLQTNMTSNMEHLQNNMTRNMENLKDDMSSNNVHLQASMCIAAQKVKNRETEQKLEEFDICL